MKEIELHEDLVIIVGVGACLERERTGIKEGCEAMSPLSLVPTSSTYSPPSSLSFSRQPWR